MKPVADCLTTPSMLSVYNLAPKSKLRPTFWFMAVDVRRTASVGSKFRMSSPSFSAPTCFSVGRSGVFCCYKIESYCSEEMP